MLEALKKTDVTKPPFKVRRRKNKREEIKSKIMMESREACLNERWKEDMEGKRKKKSMNGKMKWSMQILLTRLRLPSYQKSRRTNEIASKIKLPFFLAPTTISC